MYILVIKLETYTKLIPGYAYTLRLIVSGILKPVEFNTPQNTYIRKYNDKFLFDATTQLWNTTTKAIDETKTMEQRSWQKFIQLSWT